jgi:heme A synthase
VALAVASTLVSIFTHAPFSFGLLTFAALFIDFYMIYRIRKGDKNGYLLAAAKLFIWLVIFLVSSLLV